MISALASAVLATASVAATPSLSWKSPEDRRGLRLATALFLPVATGLLYFSLVGHMYLSLGAWPKTIGNEGFPTALLIHQDIAGLFFGALLLGLFFVWTPVVLLSCFSQRLRSSLKYQGIFAAVSLATFGLTFLAPHEFLNWWWD